MPMMKAVRMHAFGGPEVLHYEDAPRPQLAEGEVLVRVHAAGINPVDWKIREGYRKEKLQHLLPLIPGWDVAGVVEALGPGASRLQIGDKVFSRPDLNRNGAYAEFIVIREMEVALKPRSIDYLHSAAVPLAGLTAWQALFDAGGLKTGQRVLIHAAAGGVGIMAVQLAKWRGAEVIGTASVRNRDFLHGLGVNQFIDYQAERFEEVVHGVDLVLDTMGGEIQDRSWKVLKPGGILVSIVRPPPDTPVVPGVRQAFVFVQPNAGQLAQLAMLVDSGKLKVVVDTVLPLAEAARAQELNRVGHTRGKIVLTVP